MMWINLKAEVTSFRIPFFFFLLVVEAQVFESEVFLLFSSWYHSLMLNMQKLITLTCHLV